MFARLSLSLVFGTLIAASQVFALARQELDIVYASGEDRDPITLYIPDVSVPDENNTATPSDVPLVVLLRGRCMDGETVQRILRFNELVDDREFILALPEGARNRFWCSTCARLGGVLSTRYGCRSWAATPACCAATPFSLRPADPETWEPVDDVEHISQVINAVKTQYNVAEDKVYIVGWENGGFMAYRMACEKPDLLAGIVAVSGLGFADAQSNCAAFNASTKTPVNVLAIHGEFDNVPVDGGRFEGKPVPSVEINLAGWADHNRCDASSRMTTANALISRQKLLPNTPDTDLVRFGNVSQCDVSGHTELRLVRGLNTEIATALTFTAEFTPSLVDWMFSTEGVSNNGFNDGAAPSPGVETSSGPGYTFCPPDVLRCPDGEMVTRQVPTCEFQCSDGAPSLAFLEQICTSNDCCGTYGLCLSTSACADTSCPNDITLENYDTYMNSRANSPPPSGAGVVATTLALVATAAVASLLG